jgi:hypothetical protein
MKSKYIIFVVIVVLFVIGLGVFTNKAKGPSKYENFVKTLVADGTQFYGAFWCPHCQAQEKELGMSRQALESAGLYHECSNPDQSSTQICTDQQVESFPTWKFKDGVTLTSAALPTICAVKPGPAGEPAVCASASSKFWKTWIFPGYRFTIKSPTDPVRTGDVWKFPTEAAVQGETPLEFIAAQINYTLPQ